MSICANLFDAISSTATEEEIVPLLSRPGLRIERIVSTGQASPPGFWYDQDQDEWVMVVSGAALLQLADEAQPRRMKAGDYLLIPAHCRHRVDWTDPMVPTVWLALHFA